MNEMHLVNPRGNCVFGSQIQTLLLLLDLDLFVIIFVFLLASKSCLYQFSGYRFQLHFAWAGY